MTLSNTKAMREQLNDHLKTASYVSKTEKLVTRQLLLLLKQIQYFGNEDKSSEFKDDRHNLKTKQGHQDVVAEFKHETFKRFGPQPPMKSHQSSLLACSVGFEDYTRTETHQALV